MKKSSLLLSALIAASLSVMTGCDSSEEKKATDTSKPATSTTKPAEKKQINQNQPFRQRKLPVIN